MFASLTDLNRAFSPFSSFLRNENLDHFWLRYSQKRDKRLNMGVCIEGEGRLLEGGVYWVFNRKRVWGADRTI